MQASEEGSMLVTLYADSAVLTVCGLNQPVRASQEARYSLYWR